MYYVVVNLFLALIYGLPLVAIGAPLVLGAPREPAVVLGLAFLAPIEFALVFVLVAGLLSLPFQHAIRPGRFPRDLSDPTYRARRLYGLCWTTVYYMKPVYSLVLSMPWLKRLTFRLFGYRGSMEFTVYPDTWIRDLPLLDLGKGAYVSNRATLGTNVARADGTIQVDRISLGAGALVGHLSMVAFGTVLEEGAEIGVGCAVGSRCRLRKGASLAPCSSMGHLADLGEGAAVSFQSWVGSAARVGAGVSLPPAALIPNRANVASQAEADALFSSTLSPLRLLARRLAAQPEGRSDEAPGEASAAGGPSLDGGRARAASQAAVAGPGPSPAASDASGVLRAPGWNAFE